MTTIDRVLRYLEREDTWVSQHTFYELARKHSIPPRDMKHALDDVKSLINIGTEYRDRDTWLRWYDMQEEVKNQIQDALTFFEELP